MPDHNFSGNLTYDEVKKVEISGKHKSASPMVNKDNSIFCPFLKSLTKSKKLDSHIL